MAWSDAGVRTPKVFNFGEVTAVANTGFIIQEAIKGDNGEVASDGYAFARTPGKIDELGEKMGETLARMHTASTEFGFGRVRAHEEGKTMAPSWDAYLRSTIDGNASILDRIVPEIDRTKLNDVITTIRFPPEGRYVHGDYGRHNMLVTSTEPLAICVIDPNAMSGDPYWDLAHQMNRISRYEEEALHEPGNSKKQEKYQTEKRYLSALLAGYQKESGIDQLDPRRIAANRLAQLCQSLEYTAQKLTGITDAGILSEEIAKLDVKKNLIKKLYADIMQSEPAA
jgi:aminoglycoside phosphotransferase (APT) family kinase protein